MKHLHFVFPDGMLKTMLPVGSALFAPSFRKQLTAVFGYDTDMAKAITKKAKPAYRKIIDGLPNVVVNANAKTPYLAFLQTMRKKAADRCLYCQQPFCGQS